MIQNQKAEKKYLDVRRGRLRYALVGEGPPLCLVSTMSGTWHRQLRTLTKRYQVLTYDMRGFGESTSADGALPSNEEHADDLAEIIDHLDLARPPVVVGLSHGGLVAQHFALRHPNKLSGLVLTATFARAYGSTLLFLKMLHEFLEEDNIELFWRVLKRFMCSEKNWSRMMGREDLIRTSLFNRYDCRGLGAIYRSALEHDLAEQLGQLRVPTLVIGGQEDMLFPPWLTQALSEHIPQSRCVLTRTAHCPPIEEPEEFNALVTSFADTLASDA
ncbi:alpha/beta fold hydrolase [Sorangium sp. So ce1151]|uniref:alpha/beta fold hydrolase n=1 Tax=Sorangium sp. So ce1151 TaxID=3133332 RepID=UPI003F5DB471